MADGIKIRELNQTTVIDNPDALIIDKLDTFGDSSLTYYITYADVKSDLFSGDITIDGNLEINQSLTVKGNSEILGFLDVGGRLTVDGTIQTENINVSNNANINLDQLQDVDVSNAQANHYLMYNGTTWVSTEVQGGQTGGQSGEYILFETGDTPVVFEVTVGLKTSANQFFGHGSVECFYINGVESPNIMLPAGRTFIFDQSDSSNATNRLRFFEEQPESILGPSAAPGLTFDGIPGFGGARTIVKFTSTFDSFGLIEEQTPGRLYYRCEDSSHPYMGATIVNVAYALDAQIGDIDSGGDGGDGGGFPSPFTLREALQDLDRRIGTIEGTVLELE